MTTGPAQPFWEQTLGGRADLKASLALLTPREREVLALIGAGMTTRQIAEHLGRSVRTIDAHRAHISMKMRTRSLVQLVQIAVTLGLADLGGAEQK